MGSFSSDKFFLKDILEEIGIGRIQLPDFQRGWIWPDDHIQKIIASVSQSFPIGSILMLTSGGPVRFATRMIEGVEIDSDDPDKLILDGQQRLTALFQSLISDKAVYTLDSNEKKKNCWYYLDMQACVAAETDRVDAVISVPENRIVRKSRREDQLDLSSQEKEYKKDMFPVNRIFDANQWERDYLEHWRNQGDNYDDKWNLFRSFDDKVIDLFKAYQVPVITLDRNTSKEEVCLIFERVNSQGVELTVFELLTAAFAADGFDLRKDWEVRNERMKEENPVLDGLDKVKFLQALTLIAAGSCRRKEILDLTTKKYQELACQIENGFKKAACFLHKQNILTDRDLPYPPQLVPLAAILTNLGDAVETEDAQQKIGRWYWCGIFGEMYGSATETRFANDLSEVTSWIRSEESNEPSTIRTANFYADRLLELRNRNSAAYKGVYALLTPGYDFHTGQTIRSYILADVNIDTHHIFPKAWCCEEYSISSKDFLSSRFNSIINKTPLLHSTNRSIGGESPSKYLKGIRGRSAQISLFQESNQATTTEDKLNSHFISADALLTDDFEKFFEDRKEALLNAIEEAMDKNVIREDEDTSE